MRPNRASNLTSINDLDLNKIERIFQLCEDYLLTDKNISKSNNLLHDKLRGQVMASIFTQPSIRTLTGFQSSFLKLGGSIVQVPEIQSKIISQDSNEDIADIVAYLTTYLDVVVLRTEDMDIARLFLENSQCPIISAGWASHEHPLTALAHSFSILNSTGSLSMSI